MWWRVLLVGALLAGALGACAVVDPVDNRYDTVSRSLAKARDEFIFLNLVRASHDYPLSFTVVANVTPSLTNTTELPHCRRSCSGRTFHRSATLGAASGIALVHPGA